ERIEVRAVWRIHTTRASGAVAVIRSTKDLNTGQIGLERHTVIILRSIELRTTEYNRRWRIHIVAVSWPCSRLIGYTIEVRVCSDTTTDTHREGLRWAE